MRTTLRVVPFLVLLWFLTGCGATPPIQPPGLDPEEAARRVVTRLAGVESFSAEIGITFNLDTEERSASGALVVSQPGRIRMRCWGPFGVTVMDLLVVDGQVTLYLPQEERALTVDLGQHPDGEEVPSQIRAFMLMDTLLDELSTADRDWRREEGGAEPAVLLLDAGRPVTRIVYDPRTLFPLYREDLVRGTRIEYEDYQRSGERWWPGVITVTEGDLSVKVEVDDVVANPDLNPAMFVMELPEGTEIERR